MMRLMNSKEYTHLKPTSKREYTHPSPASEGCHELLRQVHHGPQYFTYLSNEFISTFAFVRPVDIVYSFLKEKN
jgi:hypothetical protein